MKYFGRRFCAFCVVLLFVSTFACSQEPWSSILSPSRAIDWSKAGLPATFPDGETTPNPWTPPTRPACTSAQAGITVPVPAGTSFSSIVTAMNSCSAANPSGSYLQLGSGTFNLSSSAYFNTAHYVTLRGSGPMSTTLSFSGTNTYLQMGQSGSAGGGTLGSNPAAGTTSVTLTGVSGVTPTVGNVAWFNQCDTGYSGATQPTLGYNACPTGSYSDNGGLFICGRSTNCGLYSGSSGQSAEYQFVLITSVTNNGGGSYTIGFSPGLYLPNWSTSNTASMYWQSPSTLGFGNGLEDMTVLFSDAASQQVQLGPGYASWIKGVRFLNRTANYQVIAGALCKNCLFSNNYLFAATPSSMTANTIGIKEFQDSDDLVLNNIAEETLFIEVDGSSLGDVISYNYAHNVTNGYVQSTDYTHDSAAPGNAFILREGNQENSTDDDDTWGTSNLNTWFRNWASCGDPPYNFGSPNAFGIAIDSFHRFDNAIANVIGGTNFCSAYSSGSNGSVFRVNNRNADPLTSATLMRWLNYDTASGSVQQNSSEVPTSLSGVAASFANTLPSLSTTAPASFFMNSAGFHPSGGTALSWWKVCTSWTTFPTSCAISTTEPFPAAGPDVSGGNYVNGHAYDNPAHLAWRTLPIDTAHQTSFAITGSSYSSGTETLTVSGLPSGTYVMGPFQINGGNCATSGAGTPTGAEVSITNASSTTVSYALASNPGTCTGTMLWPDVRQFDERVYQSDPNPNGTTSPAPPQGLAGSAQSIP